MSGVTIGWTGQGAGAAGGIGIKFAVGNEHPAAALVIDGGIRRLRSAVELAVGDRKVPQVRQNSVLLANRILDGVEQITPIHVPHKARLIIKVVVKTGD